MDLSLHIAIKRHLGEVICNRLSEEINKLGFSLKEIKHYPSFDNASFILNKDPYTGQLNLTCNWYDPANRQPVGSLQFNSDGTFYAEYDVSKTHPIKSTWFVESVTAWGSVEHIKSEPRLLMMPTD
ncbi:MAG: hypothetical protein HOP23_00415 [Methylococcaceae bacterium]|nr:hypothetical protein [Methylococcaceae bacterium]